MSREDVEYYRSRAAQERELAAAATSPEAAKAHEELARSYEILVERADRLGEAAQFRGRGDAFSRGDELQARQLAGLEDDLANSDGNETQKGLLALACSRREASQGGPFAASRYRCCLQVQTNQQVGATSPANGGRRTHGLVQRCFRCLRGPMRRKQ